MDPDESIEHHQANMTLPRFELIVTLGVRAATLADAAEVEDSILQTLVAREDVSDATGRLNDEPTDG